MASAVTRVTPELAFSGNGGSAQGHATHDGVAALHRPVDVQVTEVAPTSEKPGSQRYISAIGSGSSVRKKMQKYRQTCSKSL